MNIKFPEFKSPECLYIATCGRICDMHSERCDALQNLPFKVANYDTRRGRAFVRVTARGDLKDRLHVDCALGEYFGSGKLPVATGPLDEINDSLTEFLNLEFESSVTACFQVRLDTLPERGYIRSLSREERSGDISVGLTGGRVSISGAPIEYVEWFLDEDRANVRVFLEGAITDKFDEMLLPRLSNWAEKQFNLFVRDRSDAYNATI